MKKIMIVVLAVIVFSNFSVKAVENSKFILIHVVQKGDTLYELARDYNTTIDKILQANNLSEDVCIKLGDELVIPGQQPQETEADRQKPPWKQSLFNQDTEGQNFALTGGSNYAVRVNPEQSLPEVNIPESKIIKYHVGVGDTLYDLARSFNTSIGVIMALNNMENNMIKIGDILRLPINKLSPRQVIARTINENDVRLLARAIYAEARGEPFIGQVAVGAVVINRVLSSYFPDTFKNVIYQKGQFSAVDDGQINLTPNRTAYKAAREAIAGSDPTIGSLYYYNPRTAKNKSWFSTRRLIVTIGDHVFAK